MGKRIIRFEKTDIQSVVEQASYLHEEVKQHGVVILKGLNFEYPEMIALAEAMGV
jgi:hypothetical protein